MRVFDTVINTDFGGVEETGILLTIPDIYPEKNSVICVGRGGVKTSSSAGNISASACRSISRVSGKDGRKSSRFSRVGCLILINYAFSV